MNGPDTELLAAVTRVVAVFQTLGVEYLIGGSIASSVFGEPRQTVDADLIARLFGQFVGSHISCPLGGGSRSR